MKKTIGRTGIRAVIVCLLACAAIAFCGCSVKREMIDGERAIELAAEHRGIGVDDCSVLSVELDDGRYEIELVYDNAKYEIEIDAYTGKAVTTDVKYKTDSFDTDNKVTDTTFVDTGRDTSAPEKKITLDEAKNIAVEHFELDFASCRFVKAELDGREYEIEIVSGDREYDAEIDAYTGKVLETDVESIFD